MRAKNKEILIGLTGGIASGKTTVANYLAKKNVYLIDTDIIARDVVKPNRITTKKIYNLLGSDFFLSDGNLDREAIKKHIFNDKSIKDKYESIIMPAIRKETLNSINQIPESYYYAILIAPLLFEKGLDKYTDLNISIDIPKNLQIKRAINRKKSDKCIIEKIIKSQLSREKRNKLANFVIDNSKSVNYLYKQIGLIHLELYNLSLNKRGE